MPNASSSPLYHYTNASALLSILSSRTIWSTDIEYLNDKREFDYSAREAAQLIEAEADRLMAGEKFNPENERHSRASVLRNISTRISDVRSHGHEYYFAYVTCFCEDPDLLSQWRGYGQRQGYSLGFSRDELGAIKADTNANTQLRRVQYGPLDKSTSLSNMMRGLATHPTAHPDVTAEWQFGENVLPELASIKHPGFREEAEWRLVTTSRSIEPLFREGSVAITPYIKLKFEPHSLKQIVVGPGDNQELKARSLRRALDSQHEFAHVDIKLADVPFRP